MNTNSKISLQHKTNFNKKIKGSQTKSVYLVPEYNHILFLKNELDSNKLEQLKNKKTFRHFINRIYNSIKLYKNANNMMQHKNNKDAIVIISDILYKIFGHKNYQKIKDAINIYFNVGEKYKVGVKITEIQGDDLFGETLIENNNEGVAKEWVKKDIPFFDVVYVDNDTKKEFDKLIYNILFDIDFKKSINEYKKLFNKNRKNLLNLTDEQKEEINFISVGKKDKENSEKNSNESKFIQKKIIQIDNIKEKLYNKLLDEYKKVRVNENIIRKYNNRIRNINLRNEQCLDYEQTLKNGKSIRILEYKIKGIKKQINNSIRFIDNIKLFLTHSNEDSIVYYVKETKGRYYSIFTNVSKEFRKWFNDINDFISIDIKNSIPSSIKFMKDLFELKTNTSSIELYAKNRDELFEDIIKENKSSKNEVKTSLKKTFLTALNLEDENANIRFIKIKKTKSREKLKVLLENIKKESLDLRKEMFNKLDFIIEKLKELKLIESELNTDDINQQNILMIVYFYVEKLLMKKVINLFPLKSFYRVHDNISIQNKFLKEDKKIILEKVNEQVKKYEIEFDIE